MHSIHRKINPTSLYIHFPFCKRRCNYCGLPSTEGELSSVDVYLQAVKKELSSRAKGLELSTIFIGGGTPSLMSSDQLTSLFADIRSHAVLNEGCEVSVEVNPESVTPVFVNTLAQCGVNRVSMGVQSFVEDELTFLGRLHSVTQVYRAFDLLRDKGITNISLDLIGAFPGHTIENWKRSLQRALSLSPPHMSLYLYHREEGTVFDSLLFSGTITENAEETDVEIYNSGRRLLQDEGFQQYEISSFAVEGRKCSHNINYWLNGSYCGVGAGAASFENGCRFVNTLSLQEYIEAMNNSSSPVEYSEALDEAKGWREAVVLRLRMVEFFRLEDILPLPDAKIVAEVRSKLLLCARAGLVISDKDSFCLSGKGLLLANEVMSRVV